MKLLRVIRSVNPADGGPIEGLKQSSLSLIQQGHEIEVLSLDNGRADYIPQFPLTIHTPGEGIGTYGYCRPIKHWLNDHYADYDAVIVHGLWQYHGYAVYSVLKNSQVPYYVFTHGMLDPWFKRQYPLKHLKKCLYWPWGEYQILKHARKVFFTTEQEKQLARESFRRYSCHEHVVNYGTAGHSGDKDRQREVFLSAFPSLRKKTSLLYLSRIDPKKGTDLLIEAFAGAAADNPELQLIIAGPDQTGWQADLDQRARKLGIVDRITWTGMLTGDMKWGAFLSADAFILPSHQENFGIAVAEALSAGVPVLISDKVNIWREINQDQTGLVAADTLQGCRELIQRWITLPEQQKQAMRHKARGCFERRFEINAAAASLIGAINE